MVRVDIVADVQGKSDSGSGWNPDTVSDSGAGAGLRLRLPGAALWPSPARAPDQAVVGIVPDP